MPKLAAAPAAPESAFDDPSRGAGSSISASEKVLISFVTAMVLPSMTLANHSSGAGGAGS
ncbi:MAG: hypothetical protein BWX50_00927 [Euryarchaeota archaeon ADurb.Bin009]|nr:MAG: hypothetical protein BWX50_00927 [Euryarchaeota archaeon ADurb.Bin009]